MSALPKLLDRVLFTIIVLLMAAMVVDMTIQITFRYIIKNSPVWTEELVRYLFAWQIYLATGLAFGRGSHIVVDLVTTLAKGLLRRLLLIVSNLIVLSFLLLLVVQGWKMAIVTSNTLSTTMGVSMGLVYAALPVSAAIGAIYTLLHLVHLVRGTSDGAEPEPALMVD